MPEDIFSSSETIEENGATVDPIAEQLSQIKRADGSQMFDTVEKALESLAHAQRVIPELKANLETKEQEVSALSAKLQEAATVEDVLDRMTKSNENTNVNTGVEEVGEDKIGELVESKINALRELDTVQSNRKKVNDALVTKFGDAEKAKLALEAKAKELSVGTDFLASMADKTPKALLAYFDAAPAAQSSPTTNSVNLRMGDTTQETPLEEISLRTTNSRDQVEHMRKIREHVFKKYDVTV